VIPGRLTQISVSKSGRIFGVNKFNHLWEFVESKNSWIYHTDPYGKTNSFINVSVGSKWVVVILNSKSAWAFPIVNKLSSEISTFYYQRSSMKRWREICFVSKYRKCFPFWNPVMFCLRFLYVIGHVLYTLYLLFVLGVWFTGDIPFLYNVVLFLFIFIDLSFDIDLTMKFVSAVLDKQNNEDKKHYGSSCIKLNEDLESSLRSIVNDILISLFIFTGWIPNLFLSFIVLLIKVSFLICSFDNQFYSMFTSIYYQEEAVSEKICCGHNLFPGKWCYERVNKYLKGIKESECLQYTAWVFNLIYILITIILQFLVASFCILGLVFISVFGKDNVGFIISLQIVIGTLIGLSILSSVSSFFSDAGFSGEAELLAQLKSSPLSKLKPSKNGKDRIYIAVAKFFFSKQTLFFSLLLVLYSMADSLYLNAVYPAADVILLLAAFSLGFFNFCFGMYRVVCHSLEICATRIDKFPNFLLMDPKAKKKVTGSVDGRARLTEKEQRISKGFSALWTLTKFWIDFLFSML